MHRGSVSPFDTGRVLGTEVEPYDLSSPWSQADVGVRSNLSTCPLCDQRRKLLNLCVVLPKKEGTPSLGDRCEGSDR